MLNLAKSIRVNTRAESLSFACIFSSMVLKALGQLVYFLSSEYHTDCRSLCIVSEKHFLQTDLEVQNNTILLFFFFSKNWAHIFTTKI